MFHSHVSFLGCIFPKPCVCLRNLGKIPGVMNFMSKKEYVLPLALFKKPMRRETLCDVNCHLKFLNTRLRVLHLGFVAKPLIKPRGQNSRDPSRTRSWTRTPSEGTYFSPALKGSWLYEGWNPTIVLYMDVSENSGTPKSSILVGFSIINHPFWGTTIFGNIHIAIPSSPNITMSHQKTHPHVSKNPLIAQVRRNTCCDWTILDSLKNISQVGSFPQVRVNIKIIWNHQLDKLTKHHLHSISCCRATMLFVSRKRDFAAFENFPPSSLFFFCEWRWTHFRHETPWRKTARKVGGYHWTVKLTNKDMTWKTV